MEPADPRRDATWLEDSAALRALLEETPEAVLVESPDGHFLYANRDARDSIGVTSLEQLRGTDRREMDARFEVRNEAGQLITAESITAARALSEAEPQEVIHVRNRADGSEHWRLVKSRAVRGEGGEPRFIVTTWHDLSQRRRTEAGLRLRADAGRLLASSLDQETILSHLARLVVPALGDACFIDLVEGETVRRASVAAADPAEDEIVQALRRYPPRWSSDHPVLQTIKHGAVLFYPDLPAPVHENVLSSAHSPEHLELLLRIWFRSGIGVPLVARGQIIGSLMIAMTGSGRRHDRDDLQLAEDLGRLAGMSLDNARLYDQAQRAVHLRDEFLHVAAHELKTPLTSVRGFAQLALRRLRRSTVPDIDALKALERVDIGAQKLGRLVTQLLDISRLEAGRLKLDRRPEDLAALLGHAVSDFRGREDVGELRLDAPPSLPCSCDALRIEQVLLNLLDNAVKYSPGGAPVEVSLRGGDLARIEVRDHGIGIPPEHRARIFDRFYQAHAESHVSGMGLGLFISREIVQLHGGRLFAEFPDDGGTRFVIELPLRPAEPPAEAG